MVRLIFFVTILFSAYCTYAQTYPEPEFSNELYYLNKNDGNKLVRLEKNSSKMDSKANAISGSETSYNLEGTKSPVRVGGGSNLSFVISDGSSVSSSGGSSSSKSDSVMKANGMDPSMLSGMGGVNDPSHSITLYKVDIEKGERKVLLQKAPGMNPFGSHKLQSSDKYTFSVKKIRSGYWELVIDKPLPKGEYAFTMSGMGGSMDMTGGMLLFAFGVD
ncbi:MAG TPA: hypothetical protein VGG71_05345 [Chitinophagaceae bacterium]